MSQDVATTPPPPVNGTGQQDLAVLGALVNSVGFSPAVARALVAEVQQAGTAVALAVVPGLIDRIRSLHQARYVDLYQAVKMMNGYGPLINRNQVLQLIQQIAMTNPNVT